MNTEFKIVHKLSDLKNNILCCIEWVHIYSPFYKDFNFYDLRENPLHKEIFKELDLKVKFDDRSIVYDINHKKQFAMYSCKFTFKQYKKFKTAMKLLQDKLHELNDESINTEINHINRYIMVSFLNTYESILYKIKEVDD